MYPELEKYRTKECKQFSSIVKGRNWITPEVLYYEFIKDGVVEVSTGAKLFDLDMFGVTVVKNGCKDDNLSKCLHSREEVRNYIKELNELD